MTVNGSGFLNGSTVQWNGSTLTTSYVSGNQLTASVSGNLIAAQGTASVTVLNTGGASSNALTFTINAPSFGSVIELLVSGEVTNSGFSSIPVGTALTAYLLYDPTAVPTNSVSFPGGGGEALYKGPTNFSASLGASTITGTFPNIVVDFGKPVGNAACCVKGGDDGIEWTSTINATGPLAADPQYNATGLNPLYFTFELPHVNGILSSTILPSVFPKFPGQWTDASFFCACGPSFSGTISSVTVVPQPPSGLSIITTSPLPAGTVGVPYSQALAATGGVNPYKAWTVIGGNLPGGISLTSLGGVLTGLLNGVPTTPGTFTFTVQVTDNANATATKQFSLTITGGSVSISRTESLMRQVMPAGAFHQDS